VPTQHKDFVVHRLGTYPLTDYLHTYKQNTNKRPELFMSDQLLLLILLLPPPLQLPYYFYSQSNVSFYILASSYPRGGGIKDLGSTINYI
jgi:hypothetical protein